MADIGIILLCSHCHKQFDPLRHRPLCDCQREDATWEPYIPVRFIPEDVVDRLRAQELEANMKGGPRKLTQEEIDRAQIQADDTLPPLTPTDPATGEHLPRDLDEAGWG